MRNRCAHVQFEGFTWYSFQPNYTRSPTLSPVSSQKPASWEWVARVLAVPGHGRAVPVPCPRAQPGAWLLCGAPRFTEASYQKRRYWGGRNPQRLAPAAPPAPPPSPELLSLQVCPSVCTRPGARPLPAAPGCHPPSTSCPRDSGDQTAFALCDSPPARRQGAARRPVCAMVCPSAHPPGARGRRLVSDSVNGEAVTLGHRRETRESWRATSVNCPLDMDADGRQAGDGHLHRQEFAPRVQDAGHARLQTRKSPEPLQLGAFSSTAKPVASVRACGPLLPRDRSSVPRERLSFLPQTVRPPETGLH